MSVRRHMRDDGFTLNELVVVMALLGFVLWAAHGLFQITRIGTETANTQAWMSREIAAPLEFAERVLSQQYGFDNTFPGQSAYRCAFYTNRKGSGSTGERYVIEATTDNRLLVTTSENVGNPSYQTGTWSDANFNRAEGVDLFTYYDQDGAVITDMTRVGPDARYVVVTIVTRHGGEQLSDQRTIFFRNR